MTKKRSSKRLSTTEETPSSHAEPAKICSRSATTLKRRSGDDNLRCAAPFVRKILTHISASACTPYNPDDESAWGFCSIARLPPSKAGAVGARGDLNIPREPPRNLPRAPRIEYSSNRGI